MGRPKALLPFRGRSFLEHILTTVAGSSAGHTVVVLGHHREAIEGSVRIEHPVLNPDYEKGMVTSIQAGIRALPAGTEGALLFLVDHPMATAATVEALIRNSAPGRIILPTFGGRRGHPVLFAREILDEILALPASAGANVVVWKDPSRIDEIPVNDEGILIDIDTPEQFEKHRSE